MAALASRSGRCSVVLVLCARGGNEHPVGACVSAGFVRPDEPDKIVATGSEPLDEYQRKTQSPMIWFRPCFVAECLSKVHNISHTRLNLRKTKFPRVMPTWYNKEYAQEAKQVYPLRMVT